MKTKYLISDVLDAMYNREIHLITRQLGDDGVYRKVETNNYFVDSPATDDILIISMCNNIED